MRSSGAEGQPAPGPAGGGRDEAPSEGARGPSSAVMNAHAAAGGGDEVVTVNVGGERFTTTRCVACVELSSLLGYRSWLLGLDVEATRQSAWATGAPAQTAAGRVWGE